MKTMSCRQLGGGCEKKFQANTFEELAEMSKLHGMEMFQQNDDAHLGAIKDMMQRMQQPEAMAAWIESKRKEFDELSED